MINKLVMIVHFHIFLYKILDIFKISYNSQTIKKKYIYICRVVCN